MNFTKNTLGFLLLGTLMFGCAGLGGKDCIECLVTDVEIASGNVVKVQTFRTGDVTTSAAKLSAVLNQEKQPNPTNELLKALSLFRGGLETRFLPATASKGTLLPTGYNSAKICGAKETGESDDDYISRCVKDLNDNSVKTTVEKLQAKIEIEFKANGHEDLYTECIAADRTGNDEICDEKINALSNAFIKSTARSVESAIDLKNNSLLAACTPTAARIMNAVQKSSAGSSGIMGVLLKEITKCSIEQLDDVCYGKDSSLIDAYSVEKADLNQFLGCAIYTVATPFNFCSDVKAAGSGALEALANRFNGKGAQKGLDGCQDPIKSLDNMKSGLLWMCGAVLCASDATIQARPNQTRVCADTHDDRYHIVPGSFGAALPVFGDVCNALVLGFNTALDISQSGSIDSAMSALLGSEPEYSEEEAAAE